MTSEHSTTARWIRLGVDFKEGGNQSARRTPSKSGWDRLKLNPHTTFVVEVEGVIVVQGVQHGKAIEVVTHPEINSVQRGLTLVNRWELVFPFGVSRTRRRVRAVSFGTTNYEQSVHLSEWVTFAYRSPHKKPVSTLRVSTSFKTDVRGNHVFWLIEDGRNF